MARLKPTPPAVPAHQPADDWELLFDALLARLRQLAGDPPPLPIRPAAGDALKLVQAGVLECAVALEQVRGLIRERIGLQQQPATLQAPLWTPL